MQRFALSLGFNGAIALAAALFHLAGTNPTLTINGTPTKVKPIVQNGEIYIPLSELRRAGAQITTHEDSMSIAFIPYQGGAMQVDALEGTTGEWLFNGVWRIRVDGSKQIFDAGSNRPGYAIEMEVRNGSNKNVAMSNTGILQDVQLFDADGKQLSLDVGDFQVQMYFKELPPGGSIKHSLKFYYSSHTPLETVRKASKLLIQIDVKNGLLRDTGLKYTVKNPNFRVWFQR